MENNRLKKISTPFYMDASTTTLNEFIMHAKCDFESRVICLYEMSQQCDAKFTDDVTPERMHRYEEFFSQLKKNIYTTGFYTLFDNVGVDLKETRKFPIYHFHINPKNINFETTITNLREEFSEALMVDEVCVSQNPHIRMLKDIPNWEELFGKGEFPYMTICVFRLGNTEYFTYEIHR